MNLADVRAALKTQLLTIDGLRVYDVIPASVEAPAALIGLGDGQYDQDFDDAVTVSWGVLVVLSRADDERAQRMLDLYLSTGTAESLLAAVDADPTLDSTVDTSRVAGWDEPATVTIANTDYVAVNVRVETVG